MSSTPELSVSCAPGLEIHRIQKGDTCWNLSLDGNLDEFMGNNEGVNCDRLMVGEAVCVIPVSDPA